MNKVASFLILSCSLLVYSCSEPVKIYKNNILFKYVDNQGKHDSTGNPLSDSLKSYRVTVPFKAKITDKTDYYVIAPLDASSIDTKLSIHNSIEMSAPDPKRIAYGKKLYSPDSGSKTLKYGDYKFGVQALTIPIKIRHALANDSLYPAQVETGFNIGFSPFCKFNYNVFNPTKKTLGKNLTQYSLTTGILFGLGATDLKKTTNAPGLKSDRKSPSFSYGTFLMISVNNINFGYAIGWDDILGEGKKYWVYQNKIWHGIIIALDIIK